MERPNQTAFRVVFILVLVMGGLGMGFITRLGCIGYILKTGFFNEFHKTRMLLQVIDIQWRLNCFNSLAVNVARPQGQFKHN
jgi:hypothetical protein